MTEALANSQVKQQSSCHKVRQMTYKPFGVLVLTVGRRKSHPEPPGHPPVSGQYLVKVLSDIYHSASGIEDGGISFISVIN